MLVCGASATLVCTGHQRGSVMHFVQSSMDKNIEHIVLTDLVTYRISTKFVIGSLWSGMYMTTTYKLINSKGPRLGNMSF